LLTVSDINLFYGASQALHGVSVAAEQGKVTCILGRNGVGKTSLIRAISGLSPVKSGKLEIAGKDMTHLSTAERARSGIALVPQGREIFAQLTVEENLKTGYATLARKDRNLPEDIFDLFPVLKSMLHRRGGDLSGGQQQQLAIARALVMRPRLLLLDEPTEGIQSGSSRCCATEALWPLCWLSNISISPGAWQIVSSCLTVAARFYPGIDRCWKPQMSVPT
jgi:urea transport system ATP-binding protein